MKKKEIRLPFYDNVKSVLIFLVVIGHIIEFQTDVRSSNLWKFIYLFHMPCFVFISGFFAKKGSTLKQVACKYLVLALVFQIIYYTLNLLLGYPVSVSAFFHTPYIILWYLVSLSFWTLLLNYIDDKYLPWIIILSFVAAVVCVIVPYISIHFSAGRTIYFFPFFLLGFMVKQKNLTERWFGASLIKWFSLILLAGILLAVVSANELPLEKAAYYGRLNFIELGVTRYEALLIRAGMLSISCVAGFLFLCTVPNKATFYTKLGNRTLSIYLLHYIFVLLLRYVGFYTLVLNPWLNLALVALIAAGVYLFTSLNIFNKYINQITLKAQGLLETRKPAVSLP